MKNPAKIIKKIDPFLYHEGSAVNTIKKNISPRLYRSIFVTPKKNIKNKVKI
jgi:hypothetical protein